MFTGARVVQSFPPHDTVNLDDGNFVQWQQHIRWIIECYEITGFLEGMLLAPPFSVLSPEGFLVPNSDASTTACNVWNTTTHLFTIVIGAKLSRIHHDLHSLKICASQEVSFHANLLETVPSLPVMDFVCGGHPPSGGRWKGVPPNGPTSNYREFASPLGRGRELGISGGGAYLASGSCVPWWTKPRARVYTGSDACIGLPRILDLHVFDVSNSTGSNINAIHFGSNFDNDD
ncbi:hypothetical protein J1N35_034382 [Gossypium stocksii]|uniref:Retrotransposon Copia-like N-terminal domain-containing protein n=1 Tax=Gossypium stocksii TaxID=47602 RepID=A0A9D3ZQH1_9ROSI|nr:hypothetical protein J1N35_034382 [Gossypium stocksii]